MRGYIFSALIVLTGLLGGCGHAPDLDYLGSYEGSGYHLGPGDQVRVIVFGQDSISTNYSVDASGKLSIPLVGAVRANGRTTSQMESAIEYALRQKDLVKSPEVSVEIIAYRPFYALGEVNSPGKFTYVPGMSVQEAIATAGGYTIYADKGPVRVSRSVSGQKEVGLLSPLDSVAPGDTIYVEERLF